MISRPSKQSSSNLAGIAVHVGDPAYTPAYAIDYKAQSVQRGRRHAIHRLMGLALGPQMPFLEVKSVTIVYILKTIQGPPAEASPRQNAPWQLAAA